MPSDKGHHRRHVTPATSEREIIYIYFFSICFLFTVEKAAERSRSCWPQALVRHTRGLCGHTTQNSTQPFPMENPETEDEFVWIDNRDFFTTLPAEVPPFFPIFRLNKFNKINKIATNSEKFNAIILF
jgi:hypothetical protein